MSEGKLIGKVDLFGAAIYQTDNPEQRHAAIVFKDRAKPNVSLLHLAWHYHLLSEPLQPGYRCVPMPSFDEEELQLFAEQASRIFEENSSGIPYGMGYTGAAVFGGDLKFLESPGAGLTCATFLLGFFDTLGFEIIDVESWQSRADDVVWQGNIYALLEKRLEKDNAIAQKDLIGKAFRFRPEEVVGSVGIYQNEPLEFSESTAVGARLLAEMQKPKQAAKPQT